MGSRSGGGVPKLLQARGCVSDVWIPLIPALGFLLSGARFLLCLPYRWSRALAFAFFSVFTVPGEHWEHKEHCARAPCLHRPFSLPCFPPSLCPHPQPCCLLVPVGRPAPASVPSRSAGSQVLLLPCSRVLDAWRGRGSRAGTGSPSRGRLSGLRPGGRPVW